ncbi:glutaredoxin 3 [Cyanobacterium aponinum AL20118]|uniref:Glutaredoxin n=2 Tax=Cyanobacterium aponinum TaxID=379064 RepID=A0A844GQW9_9CHRO|nr:glutaredoxin 3 [Cyanobacterium aponinum]MTF37329.1 glutaredoxin 3 [Cyanobacterium aponinum 0216]PHV62672.1 glutaredoxin 3 [Cyanobacterium aponinum IPPAS B-1201]WPF87162.1 glutaredoxin 3 [Cyanobacterium aponinum AL20115]
MSNIISKILGQKNAYQAKVEIYTWQTCPYCIGAKLLLWWKGCNYIEYKIDGDEKARQLMIQRTEGKKTVPQIFINNKSIGGCNELYQLESESKLNFLLSQSP